MQRLGRNRGGYHGETIAIDEVVSASLAAAHHHGWRLEQLPAAPGLELAALRRHPRQPAAWSPRIYLSTGIHGDEPAGPLAVARLLATDDFPANAWLWLCPCLNPTGFPRNTREAAVGIDLNRDYRDCGMDEIRTHIDWLQRQPAFDLALCLHEDWEAAGFYVYELNPDQRPSLAEAIVDAVRDMCPIDLSPQIDGRDAAGGIIRPNLDPAQRPEWPEAFYLIQHKTRLSYTLEAPSDFALEVRVNALVAGVRAALQGIGKARPAVPTDASSKPPP